MSNSLSILGFPKSGDTFIKYFFEQILQDYIIHGHSHTVKSIEENINIFPTFCVIRKPEDSLASWYIFRSETNDKYLGAESDLNFYIRYYESLVKNKNDICFLDFDIFKNNLEYIKNKIENKLNIKINKNINAEELKKDMLIENHNIDNLPKNNQEELIEIKKIFTSMKNFNKANDLYLKILPLTK